MNKPKRKGTGYETEVLRALDIPGLKRTSAGQRWDLELPGEAPLEALATRPNYGTTLISVPIEDFAALWDAYVALRSERTVDTSGNEVFVNRPGLRVECKRREGPLWHHTIFDLKFGSRKQRRARFKQQMVEQPPRKQQQDEAQADGDEDHGPVGPRPVTPSLQHPAYGREAGEDSDQLIPGDE